MPLTALESRRATGTEAEAAARRFLEGLGWRIVAANWRCRLGELDLVGRDGDALVIVEVRSHRSRRYGTPAESVTVAKQRRLARLATAYVQTVDWRGPWRIDVVAVTFDAAGQPVIRHLVNAVTG